MGRIYKTPNPFTETTSLSTMSGIQELYALADIIQKSVKLIDESLKAKNATFPSLSQLFRPGDEVEHANTIVQRASSDIIAAAAQLAALVRPPPLTILTTAMQVC